MALSVKKGQTNIYPKIITDGLVFYLDPDNKRCLNDSGTEYTDLIQKYRGFPELLPGKLFSETNTLFLRDRNTFISTNTGNKSVFGNIGPASDLSNLENFSIQFWFKNNRSLSGQRDFLSSTTIFQKLTTSNTTISLSTNYPFVSTFHPMNVVNGLYSWSGNFKNSKKVYSRSIGSAQAAYNMGYMRDEDGVLKWTLYRINIGNQDGLGVFSKYFIANNDAGNPYDVSSWSLVLTAVKLNSGFPDNFFGISSNLNSTFYPLVSSSEVIVYAYSNSTLDTSSQLRRRLIAPNSFLWSYNVGLLEYSLSSNNPSPYPWSLPPLTSNNSILSCFSNVDNILQKNYSGGWVGDSFTLNDRPYYFRETSFFGAGDFVFDEIGYFTVEDYQGFISEDGWYVSYYSLAGTYTIGFSSNSTASNPWEVEQWTFNKAAFPQVTFTPYFSVVKIPTPILVADPLPPSNFSNTSLIVSAEFLPYNYNYAGFSLSGTNNTLLFSYEDNNTVPFSEKINLDINTWNCVTFVQSGKKITLYVNDKVIEHFNNSTKLYSLSSIFITQDLLIGQILIYNKSLSAIEVKTNYDNFKSKYRVNNELTFPLPKPVITSTGSITGIPNSNISYQIIATNRPKSFDSSRIPSLNINTNTKTGLLTGKFSNTLGLTSVVLSAFNPAGVGTKILNIHTAYTEPLYAYFESYGNFVNGTNIDVYEADIKTISSWPDWLRRVFLYVDYVSFSFIDGETDLEITVNDVIVDINHPDNFYFRDDGYGLGMANYVDALNNLIDNFDITGQGLNNLKFYTAMGNNLVARANIGSDRVTVKLKMTEYYENDDGEEFVSCHYDLLKNREFIYDFVENIGMPWGPL